jgi:hypothetical protein
VLLLLLREKTPESAYCFHPLLTLLFYRCISDTGQLARPSKGWHGRKPISVCAGKQQPAERVGACR